MILDWAAFGSPFVRWNIANQESRIANHEFKHQRQLPPIGRTDDTMRLCMLVDALAVVPLVPTAPLAPEPLTLADALPDPLALASARSPLLLALESAVLARSDAALRSRSRVVALALADVSA